MTRASYAITLLTLTVLWSAPPALGQSAVQPELVIREVILPKLTSSQEGWWGLPMLMSEPGDSRSSALVTGQGIYTATRELAPLYCMVHASRRTVGGLDTDQVNMGTFITKPLMAIARQPGGRVFVAQDVQRNPDLRVWDFDTHEFLGWIDHPPPPPGKNPINGFQFIQTAGDVDGDGWDDLFFQSWTSANEGVAGCISGRLNKALWMHYVADGDNSSRVMPLMPGTPQDLNGDGVGDFIAGFLRGRVSTPRQTIIALSGIDGAVIWESDLSIADVGRQAIICHDLDGDSVQDVVSMEAPSGFFGWMGDLTAISGRTGQTIWSTDCSFIGNYAPGALDWGGNGVLMTSPSPDGSGIDLVLGCRHYYQSVGTESFWVALDAQTGTSDQLIDYDVPTLEPWHSEPVPAWLWSLIQTGDYDGDGFQEIATQAELVSEDRSVSTITPVALVILGQRTLFGPDAPSLGSSEDFHIALPTLAGARAQLVFSGSFAPRGDARAYTPDDWPTALGQGWLIQRTSNHPSLQETLDVNGQATITVTIPSNSALVGNTIYARGLIEDPVQPGVIRTQTSLHWMTIQP